jgi:hypothetical protein
MLRVEVLGIEGGFSRDTTTDAAVHRPQETPDWRRTDFQTECDRPDFLVEEMEASPRGEGEKTSNPVLEGNTV